MRGPIPFLAIVLATVLLAGPAAAEAPAAASTAPARQPEVRRVVVTFTGFQSDRGRLRASLYASADGFPAKHEKSFRKVEAPIRGGTARVVFEDVPLGIYGVAGFHDENGNSTLDQNWVGIPTEGIGCSNDARGSMGPPKFEDARFKVADQDRELTVRMVY